MGTLPGFWSNWRAGATYSIIVYCDGIRYSAPDLSVNQRLSSEACCELSKIKTASERAVEIRRVTSRASVWLWICALERLVRLNPSMRGLKISVSRMAVIASTTRSSTRVKARRALCNEVVRFVFDIILCSDLIRFDPPARAVPGETRCMHRLAAYGRRTARRFDRDSQAGRSRPGKVNAFAPGTEAYPYPAFASASCSPR